MEKYPVKVNKRDPISKGYRSLVFYPNASVQDADMNDMNAIEEYNNEKLITSMYFNGSILKGGTLTIDGDIVTISETLTQIDGLMFEIPETSIPVDTNSIVEIGLYLDKKYISYNDDPDLLNPAIGTKNYKRPGGDRVKCVVGWVVAGDPSVDEFYSVFTIDHGVYNYISPDQIREEEYTRLIQKYDYTSRGNFVVTGMDVSYNGVDDRGIRIKVSAGYARVEGREIDIAVDRIVHLQDMFDTRSVSGEPIVLTGSDSGQSYLYKLRKNNLFHISRAVVNKMETKILTRGPYTGSKDLISTDTVLRINSVVGTVDGIDGKYTFSESVDYKQSGDSIDWSPEGGNQPSPGTTYEVTYTIIKNIFDLSIKDDSVEISGEYLQNSTAFIDYSYSLNRIDTVCLMSDGNFTVFRGNPSEGIPSTYTHNAGITLANILLRPGKSPYIYHSNHRVHKKSDLNKMQRDIRDIKYNIARLSLSDEIKANDPSSTKRSQFVDPFLNSNQVDRWYEQDHHINSGILESSTNWSTTNVSLESKGKVQGTDEEIITQDKRTKAIVVGRFISQESRGISVTIEPQHMRWVKELFEIDLTGPTDDSFSTEVIIEGTHIVSPYMMQISGKNFLPGEQIYLYIDDEYYPSDVLVREDGTFLYNMSTPEGMKSGSKKLTIVGLESGEHYTTNFSANPVVLKNYSSTINTTEETNVTNIIEVGDTIAIPCMFNADNWVTFYPCDPNGVMLGNNFSVRGSANELSFSPFRTHIAGVRGYDGWYYWKIEVLKAWRTIYANTGMTLLTPDSKRTAQYRRISGSSSWYIDGYGHHGGWWHHGPWMNTTAHAWFWLRYNIDPNKNPLVTEGVYY